MKISELDISGAMIGNWSESFGCVFVFCANPTSPKTYHGYMQVAQVGNRFFGQLNGLTAGILGETIVVQRDIGNDDYQTATLTVLTEEVHGGRDYYVIRGQTTGTGASGATALLVPNPKLGC